MDNHAKMDRRGFIRTAGAVGIGSIVAARMGVADDQAARPESLKVPKRRLGKTGVDVACLSLGMMFNAVDNQLMLHKCMQWGVDYWDTAYGYNGGNSELGIGKFLSRDPERRKDLFIVSKASLSGMPKTIETVESRLQESLSRMGTSYVDLYYGVHGLDDPAELNEDLRRWAQSAKERGLIKFFGFSTHKNMVECLNAASKLDWIDAVITSYNFRLMQDQAMQDAVQACYDAGIGLTAMKVQGHGSARDIATDGDKELTAHFTQRGFTAGQAKIKAVLEDKRMSSACLGRGKVEHMAMNVAAVLDKTSLTAADRAVFGRVAKSTCGGYCAGCGSVCAMAVPEMPYVSEVMRYMMYCDGYGQADEARQLFAKLPAEAREKLPYADYSAAETVCPQRMPITRLMAEAARKLA